MDRVRHRPGASSSREADRDIEILSLVNKRPSHNAYPKYLRKRRDLLRSSAHLIGIDLLRGSVRSPLVDEVPTAPYYITLSRANHRPNVVVWLIQFQHALPILPVPLTEPDPDVHLDMNAALAAVYERCGYATLIDYHRPPPPDRADQQTIVGRIEIDKLDGISNSHTIYGIQVQHKEKNMKGSRLTRRNFLQLSATTATVAFLAGCAVPAPPEPAESAAESDGADVEVLGTGEIVLNQWDGIGGPDGVVMTQMIKDFAGWFRIRFTLLIHR
ncbi:DUF4058 family protein [Chloroflexi bacterium TSY]|nr:DUF4058 family protein [Chloroflexi bacterium TSY]